MEIVQKYFKDLSDSQILQLSRLKELYSYWNSKINVISRKDIDNLYLHHVLHSLSIGKIISFTKGTKVLDVGTGGGFPGIPLAILFPDTNFVLIDSIAKKIKVVDDVIKVLGLKNAEAKQINVLNLNAKFDFVVSRAVSSLPEFYNITKKLISNVNKNKLKNGVLYLKGGDITNELDMIKTGNEIINVSVFNISNYFQEPFYSTKIIVHIE